MGQLHLKHEERVLPRKRCFLTEKRGGRDQSKQLSHGREGGLLGSRWNSSLSLLSVAVERFQYLVA